MPTLANTAAMEAACIWLIYAAARVWDNVCYGRTYDPEDFGTGPDCKMLAARGWKGYERDRWEVWGERLRCFASFIRRIRFSSADTMTHRLSRG